MARGRMISTTLGESRKFAQLASDLHRLIYVLVLPHVDREGRFEADPILISGRCLTRLNIDPSKVEAWLNDAAEVGLIKYYEVDGLPVLQIVDFLEHNTPHHRERPSRLPSPEEGTPIGTHNSMLDPKQDPSKAEARPKQGRSKPIIKENKRELNKRELNTHVVSEKSENDARLIPKLIEAWNTHSGKLPKAEAISPSRQTGLKRLIKTAKNSNTDPIQLLTAATIVVARDEFWQKRNYDLDTLLAGDKYLKYAEKGVAIAKNNPTELLTREEQALKILTERENPNA